LWDIMTTGRVSNPSTSTPGEAISSLVERFIGPRMRSMPGAEPVRRRRRAARGRHRVVLALEEAEEAGPVLVELVVEVVDDPPRPADGRPSRSARK
jgi:hypothetical protein